MNLCKSIKSENLLKTRNLKGLPWGGDLYVGPEGGRQPLMGEGQTEQHMQRLRAEKEFDKSFYSVLWVG